MAVGVQWRRPLPTWSRRPLFGALTILACAAATAGGLFLRLQPATSFTQATQTVLGSVGDGGVASCRVARMLLLVPPILLCPANRAAQAAAPSGDAAVAELLRNVKVFAVADESGAPVMEAEPNGRFIGYFYIREQEAQDRLKSLSGQMQGLQLLTVPLSEVYTSYIVRGEEALLGGRLQLQPDTREVRYALKRLNDAPTLGKESCLVPLFLSPDLMLKDGGALLFLHETDLLKAMNKLLGTMNKEVKVTTLQGVAAQVSVAKRDDEERFFIVSNLSDLGNFE